ncbi:MAG: hypothetical protein ACRBB6_06940 [Neptuniibacter sp.]
MDATSIFIIVISTLLAIVFKFVLYKKIQRWMDQDLIKGLAEGNNEKFIYLTAEYDLLVTQKTKRKEYPKRLTELADQFEQKG